MADESNAEIVETTPPAEIAPPKKKPGPKPKKDVSEGASEVAATEVPKAKGRQKRADKPTASTTVAATKPTNTDKGVRKTRVVKPATPAPAPVLDDIADLLQLEEENAQLRKALAKKLRTENTELRKRLGLA